MPSCHRAAILPLLKTKTSPRSYSLPLKVTPSCSYGIGNLALRFYATSILSRPRIRYGSVRRQKRRRQSPTSDLIDALQAYGGQAILPYTAIHKLGAKVDLSYVNLRKVRRSRLPRVKHSSLNGGEPRLQNILATHLRRRQSFGRAEAQINTSITNTSPIGNANLSQEESQLLASRGYDYNDVSTWASIVGEESDDVAANRLLFHGRPSTQLTDASHKPLPVFVPLFFLRRSNVSPAALRCLLIYSWQEVYRKQAHRLVEARHIKPPDATKHGQIGYPVMNDSSIFILIVRLLRHARVVWPEALVTITSMFIEVFGNSISIPRSYRYLRKKSPLSYITASFNHMLALLALPSSIRPFQAISYHQRAQFDLLQVMARHSPPLVITRNSYRAILSVQLANKKTEQERDWDNLKAKSWPPWKQEKTGLDAEKGPAYGTSRALEVLKRSREAGYGAASWNRKAFVWDKVATILAGWDVDGSPTIQTRALLLHKFVSHKGMAQTPQSRAILMDPTAFNNDEAIWAARIRTTRTVDEAWACFLAYSDCGLPPKREIYFAMLDKLANEHRRKLQLRFDDAKSGHPPGNLLRPLNAGDSKELAAPPLSPKEATFVRIQPPSFHDLACEMYHNGIMPSRVLTNFLVMYAETLSHGLQYIHWVKQLWPSVDSLLLPEQHEDHSRIREVPLRVFSLFIHLLCRFPGGDRIPSETAQNDQPHLPTVTACRSIHGLGPVTLAYRLLKTRRPLYRQPWHKVLSVMSWTGRKQSGGVEKDFVQHRLAQLLHRWSVMQELVTEMKSIGLSMDNESLYYMCRHIEFVVFAALQTNYAPMDSDSISSKTDPIDDELDEWTSKSVFDANVANQVSSLLSTGPQLVRAAFHELAGTGKHLRVAIDLKEHANATLPRLLATPSATTLHAYTRTLGLLCDWQGILDTLRWMVKYEGEIAEAISMPRNGPRMLRRTIIAARVFLEGMWIDYDPLDDETLDQVMDSIKVKYAAPRRTVNGARRLVESIEAWGGWPSDAEVEEYCTAPNSRFPSVELISRRGGYLYHRLRV